MLWYWYRKRTEGLHILYQFLPLKCLCLTKKHSYPLPRIQEALESLVGAGHFSCLDLKSRFWQIKMEETSKQYTAFTVGNLGFFECDRMPFGLCNAPATFQWLSAELYGWVKPHLLFDLPRWPNLCFHRWQRSTYIDCVSYSTDLQEYNFKLKPSKCSLFKEEINYLAHQVSKWGVQPSNENLKAIAECAPLHKLTPRLEPSLALWVTIGGS